MLNFDIQNHILQKYKLVIREKIGQGLHCSVYKLVGFNCPSLRLCLKLYEFDSDKNVKALKNGTRLKMQFEMEFRMLQQLQAEKCVPRLISFGQFKEYAYIIMQYFENGSLSHFASKFVSHNQTSISRKQIQLMMFKVLNTLIILEEYNIIHRDLKFQNIMVGQMGQIKLIDLATAQIQLDLKEKNGEVKSKSCNWQRILQLDLILNGNSEYLVGSKNYICPQLISGHRKRYISSKIDVWSFGVMLYKLLTKQFPFSSGQNEKMNSLLRRIRQQQPEIPEILQAEEKEVIELCLKKNPNDRPLASQLTLTTYFKEMQAIFGYSVGKEKWQSQFYETKKLRILKQGLRIKIVKLSFQWLNEVEQQSGSYKSNWKNVGMQLITNGNKIRSINFINTKVKSSKAQEKYLIKVKTKNLKISKKACCRLKIEQQKLSQKSAYFFSILLQFQDLQQMEKTLCVLSIFRINNA